MLGYESAYAVFDLTPAEGQNTQCVSYIYRQQGGEAFRPLEARCGPTASLPQVGANSIVSAPKCGNVRSIPGQGLEVLDCIANGTSVAIDDGPVAQNGGTVTVFWHVRGVGWIAHQLLTPP